MGNSPSTRRVTVVNDDVVGVVQVSENVVRRLRGDPEKPYKERPKTPVRETLKSPPTAYPSEPASVGSIEPYLTTLEMRQNFNEEYQQAEKSWQRRIKELERQNQQLFKSSNDKTAEVLTEIETNYMNNTFAPVCPDKEQKVLDCVEKNAKHPLKCSQEVRDYIDCVEKARMSALVKEITSN